MFSSFRNFMIAFVVAALIFSGIGYFITKKLNTAIDDIINPVEDIGEIIKQTTEPATQPPQTTASVEPPVIEDLKGDSFTLLFAVTDYDPITYDDYLPENLTFEDMLMKYGSEYPDYEFLKTYRMPEVRSLIVLRGEKETRRFDLFSLSSKMKTDTAASITTIGKVFRYYKKGQDPLGMNLIRDRVFMLTGTPVNDVFVVNVTEMNRFAAAIGSVVVNLPYTVYTDGESYFTVLPQDAVYEPGQEPSVYMEKGSHALTADELKALFLLSERYEKDVTNKAEILVLIADQILKNLAGKTTDELKDLYYLLTGTNAKTAPTDPTTPPSTSEDGTVISPPEKTIVSDPSNPKGTVLVSTNLTITRLEKQADLFSRYLTYENNRPVYPQTYKLKSDSVVEQVIPNLIDGHNLFFDYRIQ